MRIGMSMHTTRRPLDGISQIVSALLLWCCLAWAAAAAGQAPSATSDGMFDGEKCLAQPGGVRAELRQVDAAVEIIDWSTSPMTDKGAGTFLLPMKETAALGSLVLYGSCEAGCLVGGVLRPMDGAGEAGRELRVMPFPAGEAVEAVQIVASAHLTVETLTLGPTYQAKLPVVTFLPFRAVNIASRAAVTVSSADEPSQGFQPQPWLNRPETLVDGFIDDRWNFSTAKRDADITADQPEWVMLSWPRPETFRAVMVFRGNAEKGLGQGIVEQHVGGGEPRFATGNADWKPLDGRWTKEGRFRSQAMFIPAGPVTTRGLRLRSTGGVKQIGLGEIVVLCDLASAPAPGKDEATEGSVGIPFEIPAPGKVTVQVRDATGRVVANPVTGVEFPAGRSLARWDLTDVEGKPVLQPGTYRWHGLYNPGLEVEYKYTYFPYPLANVAWQTPSRKGGWLADHEPPRTIARAGEHMWLGAFAEAGDSIVEVDADMNKLWGIDRIWVAIPAEICTDGDSYFGWCEGGWIGDNQAIIQIETSSKRSRKVFQREMPKKNVAPDAMRSGPMKRGVTGFQVVGGRAFVSFGALDVVQVFDVSKGLAGPWRGFGWDVAYKQFDDQKPVLLQEITLPSPGRLRKYGASKLVTTSGKDVVTIDLADYTIMPLFKDKLVKPLGLGVDAQGNVYVGDGEGHQVFGFSSVGERIATLGKPGRREVGLFDENDLQDPYGVEVDMRGRVWVMENSDWPKRVSVWDPATGKCIKSVYGPAQYGGGGCIDPADDTRLFYKGMEFRRDAATGKVTPVNLYYRPESKAFARFPDNDYPEYAFRSQGKLWFTSFMWPHGHPTLVLWQYQKDHAVPVAAMGGAVALRETFGLAPASKGDSKAWRDTSFLKDIVPGYDEDRKVFTWTDLNDDARVQPEELKFGKLEAGGRLAGSVGAGWNWRMNDKFETSCNAEGGFMVFFKPKGFTRQGYPLYDVPTDVVRGSGEAHMPDSKGNSIVLGGPLTCVQPDGTVRWRYRNEWPGLHAGHNTTARGDEAGVLIAPTRIWGIVDASAALGEVVCFNSNLGCTYLMTTDDGLYIDRIFRDQRVGLLWRMETPPTPDVLAETSTYDEHFGGTFQTARSADGKRHVYYVVGKNHCSVVELTGLDKIQRLTGGTFTVTPEQVAAAQAARQIAAARTAQPKVYDVPHVKPGAIVLDGKDNDWPAQRIDSFALAWDSEKLYVLHAGRDRSPVFENKGVNPLELFKTGDVVDVMLQTAPTAVAGGAGRTGAGVGDIRLSFSMFEGKPVCVLYDFKSVSPVPGQQRVAFSSPWRTVWCDRVGILPEAQIKVTRSGDRFVLEAAVPLKAIGLDPERLQQARGDVGRVMGDQTGTAATSREYWSNKNTALMSDLPSEAGLQPNLWGLFRYQSAGQAVVLTP